MTNTTPASTASPGRTDTASQPLRTVQRALRIGRLRDPQRTPDAGRLVMVTNRIVRRDDAQSGRLAMIVRSVLRERGGLWFGWSGSVTEKPAVTEKHDRRDRFDSAAIDFDAADHAAFFEGFPARTLHPLLESRLQDMDFDRHAMQAWFDVNARLATSLKTRLKPNDRIWIHGLHLLPLARELRALGVENRIGFFVHEALPPCSLLTSLPQHQQVFGGLAACDVVGVQTTRDLNALHDYLTGFLRASGTHGGGLRLGTRSVRLAAFPVGIDVERIAGLAQRAEGRDLLRRFRANLGEHKLLIGVDRPNHASGLCQRLHAVDHLLQHSPQLAGTFSMLQISPPVRYDMPRCRELDREISRHVSDINGRHGSPAWSPLRYVKKGFRQSVLAGYLRAADVGVMTPLRDGMTLAAKEYVACQDPSDPGVLVLSRFAGAAEQLTDAVQVNPLDIGDMAAGIRTALRMPLAERQARWKALMRTLQRQDVQRWSNDFLEALTPSQVSGSRKAATTPTTVGARARV